MSNDSAEHIKASFIDWLIAHHEDIVIGNEVMYGSKRKVVDLLAIIKDKIVAIEIKSAFDKLARLPEQIVECSKIFDRIIVVSTPSHIAGITSIISSRIGFYIIDASIKAKQKPLLIYNQDKLEMLYSISTTFLKKQYPQYRNLKENEIRFLLSKEKKTDIHRLMVSFYRQRLNEKFQMFMSDRGAHTLVDDIPTLSSLTRIELF